jgi:hypothetical protein
MSTTEVKVNAKGWEMETVRWSEVERESEKAILVGISLTGGFSDVWVPKSVIENKINETGSSGTMELPAWWLKKNGF